MRDEARNMQRYGSHEGRDGRVLKKTQSCFAEGRRRFGCIESVSYV